MQPDRGRFREHCGQHCLVAAQQAAKATPDGYTLFTGSASSLVSNPYVFKSVGYDTLRDFMALGHLAETGYMIAVHPDVPDREARVDWRREISLRRRRLASNRHARPARLHRLLAVTMIYLLLFRVGTAVGASGAVPPQVAAWAPNARAAGGWATVVFMLVMFFGGAYLPRFLMPEFLIRVGEYLPPGVGALQESWLGAAPDPVQLGILALVTLAAGTVAAKSFRWE